MILRDKKEGEDKEGERGRKERDEKWHYESMNVGDFCNDRLIV